MSFDPATLFTSIKFAYDFAKGINSLNSTVERNEAIAKTVEILRAVQDDALTMRERYSLLLTEKDNLIKKISEFEKWSEIERQYELKEIAPGVFVYAYQKTDKAIEPAHWICAKCYNERKKSILQRSKKDGHGTHYKCHTCGSTILDHSDSEDYSDFASGVVIS
jgi:hypothetical protein